MLANACLNPPLPPPQQALHKSVKDKDLPLASSVLWAQHVLPCRPAGAQLDIKRSKHKKMSKWLQVSGQSLGTF